MASLILIPWALTDWSVAGRLSGRTCLPLCESGRDQACAWAERIADFNVARIYSSDEQSAVETARIISERTGGRCKTAADLSEVDVGLWDGLTAEELNRRHTKSFKRWLADPTSVCPPEGEDMVEAFDRVSAAVVSLVQRNPKDTVGIVLGPLALGLARCRLESIEPAEMRSLDNADPVHYESVELDEQSSAKDVVSPPSVIVAQPESQPTGASPEGNS